MSEDNSEEKSEEEQAKELAEREQREFDNALTWVLSDPRGRKVMWWLLSLCGVFRISFTGNSQTFFNEGMRNVGNQLMTHIMRVKPSVYQEMYEESRKPPVTDE